MHMLLQWAVRQGAWQQVTALPLNAAEEQVSAVLSRGSGVYGQVLMPASPPADDAVAMSACMRCSHLCSLPCAFTHFTDMHTIRQRQIVICQLLVSR